jgi:hypothetical protein
VKASHLEFANGIKLVNYVLQLHWIKIISKLEFLKTNGGMLMEIAKN